MINAKSTRQQLEERWVTLSNERSGWVSQWQQISKFLLPAAGRFFETDRNRGGNRHNNILDSTATRALRVLAAGMMSGMTSPARPWFRLGIADDELMQYAPVKVYLDEVAKRMRRVFSQSNTYRALHSMYEELGAFGTAANIIADDFDNVIHHNPLTCGEYCIATDDKGRVATLYRRFQMTVSQMVRKFGREACSQTVRNMYDLGRLEEWVTITHAIEPRYDRDVTKLDAANMRWRSVYFEAAREDHTSVLAEGGYRDFPALVPRWWVTGGDVYGTGPGAEALGDVKQLQQEQLRKGQGIDYMTKPPLQAPAALKNAGVDTLPGGVTYYDTAGGQAAIRSAWEVRLDLSHLLADIVDVRQRINGAFYADLFLMLANDTKGEMTATEVAERHEEKLLMLGPTLERLANEMFDPLIDRTFNRMAEVGILPEPPKELAGMDISVEYIGVLAQAQRAVGINSINRLLGIAGGMAQFKPDVMDKINADEVIDQAADMLGVDPAIVVPDEDVIALRQQRAQQQAAMAAAQAAAPAAQAAKNAAEAGAIAQGSGLMDALTGYN